MPSVDSRTRALPAIFVAVAFALGLQAAHALFDLGGRGLDGFMSDGLYSGVELVAVGLCLTRVLTRAEDRAAWVLITAGLIAWTAGDLVWSVSLSGLGNSHSPSVADGLYLAMYPAVYGGLMLMMRARFRRVGAAMWLDGIVVGLTAAAVSADLVFPTVLSSGSENPTSAAINLAYPLGDFSLLVFIALGFALSGWRPGRQWFLLTFGIAVSACADLVFLYQEAHGIYVEGRILDTMWPLSMALLALSAWQPSPMKVRRNVISEHTVLLPVAFGAVALGLLVSSSFRPLTPLAVGLATSAMATAGVRAALTHLQNVRMLQRETRNAVTDALTGLGNRRRLIEDLELAIEHGLRGRPATLAFFDLDGFKRYNDSFGHGAGDALLIRLGKSLAASVAGVGEAYRLGGDEFCILIDGALAREHATVTGAQEALAEHGSGFTVSASCGAVTVPAEAVSVSETLNLADERMYADKADRGGSSRSRAQTVLMQQSVLMQLLTEREPRLREHVCDVGQLAMIVGRHFELNSEQLDELRRAAELHDLGKLAIPDQILNKPEPLSDSEWRLMRQHTLIGERILNAAPALRPVARLVRSSHERWDGAGYPDALAGDEIPLGSRIIAACDAYDAIVSERPYDAARSPAEALEELRRNAGTQFDPQVVQAICEHLAVGAGSSFQARTAASVPVRP
jgi:two-component system, cell cycle response regulator